MEHPLQKRYLWCLLAILSLPFTGMAQVTTVTSTAAPLDLEQCISIALSKNPQARQAELQVQSSSNNFEQSKWQRWPSLNFNASQGFSFGRTIDPFTNQFVQQRVNSNSYQLGSSVVLFSGFQIENTIKQNNLTLQASRKDLEATRNDIMLNVALSYLQVLNNQELIEVARLQLEATNYQLERTQKLVDAGSLAQASLYDLNAQLANDELAVVNAENNLELAKLSLKQYMNLPSTETVNIKSIPLADPSLKVYDATIQEIYESALNNLPQMQAAIFRTQAAAKGVEVAKGLRLPTLSLSGGINTAFSSVAPSERYVADGTGSTTIDIPSTTRFIDVNGTRIPLIESTTVPNGSIQHFGYFDQLNFNRNSAISLNLRIPIFTNFQNKYRLAGARIQQMNTEYQSETVKLQIRQNVEQAYINMSNAAKRYSATSNQVRALQEAYRIAESRFTVGALNSAEFNIAKANLDRARANLVQTKYDYIFRTKILDFYRARPLTLD